MIQFYEIIIFASIGVILRFILGILNALAEKTLTELNWSRIVYEGIYGIILGMLAVTGLRTWLPSMNNLPDSLIAGLAGLCGADLFNIKLKKFGLPKITFTLATTTNINTRQQKALKLARTQAITNNIYQKLNAVSDSTAQRELKQLVNKKLLKAQGTNRAKKYILP